MKHSPTRLGSRATRAATAFLAGALVLVLAGTLAAHDFWIVPNAFEVAGDGWIEVKGQTSTRFPTSPA